MRALIASVEAEQEVKRDLTSLSEEESAWENAVSLTFDVESASALQALSHSVKSDIAKYVLGTATEAEQISLEEIQSPMDLERITSLSQWVSPRQHPREDLNRVLTARKALIQQGMQLLDSAHTIPGVSQQSTNDLADIAHDVGIVPYEDTTAQQDGIDRRTYYVQNIAWVQLKRIHMNHLKLDVQGQVHSVDVTNYRNHGTVSTNSGPIDLEQGATATMTIPPGLYGIYLSRGILTQLDQAGLFDLVDSNAVQELLNEHPIDFVPVLVREHLLSRESIQRYDKETLRTAFVAFNPHLSEAQASQEFEQAYVDASPKKAESQVLNEHKTFSSSVDPSGIACSDCGDVLSLVQIAVEQGNYAGAQALLADHLKQLEGDLGTLNGVTQLIGTAFVDLAEKRTLAGLKNLQLAINMLQPYEDNAQELRASLRYLQRVHSTTNAHNTIVSFTAFAGEQVDTIEPGTLGGLVNFMVDPSATDLRAEDRASLGNEMADIAEAIRAVIGNQDPSMDEIIDHAGRELEHRFQGLETRVSEIERIAQDLRAAGETAKADNLEGLLARASQGDGKNQGLFEDNGELKFLYNDGDGPISRPLYITEEGRVWLAKEQQYAMYQRERFGSELHRLMGFNVPQTRRINGMTATEFIPDLKTTTIELGLERTRQLMQDLNQERKRSVVAAILSSVHPSSEETHMDRHFGNVGIRVGDTPELVPLDFEGGPLDRTFSIRYAAAKLAVSQSLNIEDTAEDILSTVEGVDLSALMEQAVRAAHVQGTALEQDISTNVERLPEILDNLLDYFWIKPSEDLQGIFDQGSENLQALAKTPGITEDILNILFPVEHFNKLLHPQQIVRLDEMEFTLEVLTKPLSSTILDIVNHVWVDKLMGPFGIGFDEIRTVESLVGEHFSFLDLVLAHKAGYTTEIVAGDILVRMPAFTSYTVGFGNEHNIDLEGVHIGFHSTRTSLGDQPIPTPPNPPEFAVVNIRGDTYVSVQKAGSGVEINGQQLSDGDSVLLNDVLTVTIETGELTLRPPNQLARDDMEVLFGQVDHVNTALETYAATVRLLNVEDNRCNGCVARARSVAAALQSEFPSDQALNDAAQIVSDLVVADQQLLSQELNSEERFAYTMSVMLTRARISLAEKDYAGALDRLQFAKEYATGRFPEQTLALTAAIEQVQQEIQDKKDIFVQVISLLQLAPGISLPLDNPRVMGRIASVAASPYQTESSIAGLPIDDKTKHAVRSLRFYVAQLRLDKLSHEEVVEVVGQSNWNHIQQRIDDESETQTGEEFPALSLCSARFGLSFATMSKVEKQTLSHYLLGNLPIPPHFVMFQDFPARNVLIELRNELSAINSQVPAPQLAAEIAKLDRTPHNGPEQFKPYVPDPQIPVLVLGLTANEQTGEEILEQFSKDVAAQTNKNVIDRGESSVSGFSITEIQEFYEVQQSQVHQRAVPQNMPLMERIKGYIEIARGKGEIHFNLDGIDLDRALGQGLIMRNAQGSYTADEMVVILSNPDLYGITTWYRNGQVLTPTEAQQVFEQYATNLFPNKEETEPVDIEVNSVNFDEGETITIEVPTGAKSKETEPALPMLPVIEVSEETVRAESLSELSPETLSEIDKWLFAPPNPWRTGRAQLPPLAAAQVSPELGEWLLSQRNVVLAEREAGASDRTIGELLQDAPIYHYQLSSLRAIAQEAWEKKDTLTWYPIDSALKNAKSEGLVESGLWRTNNRLLYLDGMKRTHPVYATKDGTLWVEKEQTYSEYKKELAVNSLATRFGLSTPEIRRHGGFTLVAFDPHSTPLSRMNDAEQTFFKNDHQDTLRKKLIHTLLVTETTTTSEGDTLFALDFDQDNILGTRGFISFERASRSEYHTPAVAANILVNAGILDNADSAENFDQYREGRNMQARVERAIADAGIEGTLYASILLRNVALLSDHLEVLIAEVNPPQVRDVADIAQIVSAAEHHISEATLEALVDIDVYKQMTPSEQAVKLQALRNGIAKLTMPYSSSQFRYQDDASVHNLVRGRTFDVEGKPIDQGWTLDKLSRLPEHVKQSTSLLELIQARQQGNLATVNVLGQVTEIPGQYRFTIGSTTESDVTVNSGDGVGYELEVRYDNDENVGLTLSAGSAPIFVGTTNEKLQARGYLQGETVRVDANNPVHLFIGERHIELELPAPSLAQQQAGLIALPTLN